MAIARKKPEDQKTPKSPTKVAKDTGLSSVKRKETLYKGGKEVSREEFIAWDPTAAEILEKVDAIRSAKPPTKKSIQDAAKAEKAKAKNGKPGKLEKFIMAAVPETEEIFMGAAEAEDTIETTEKIVPGKKATKSSKDSKTAKNKSKDSQNGGKDTIVQNPPKAQGKDPKDEAREKRTQQLLETCQGYAGSLVQKSRYKNTDPNKLVFAAFLAIPKHKETEQGRFAEAMGVHRNTLTNWKFDPKVIKARNEIMMKHVQFNTPDILEAMVNGAQKSNWNTGLGDAAMIKLYLQYVEQWNEKQEIDHTSDGKAITWGIAPSQFVRKENVPDPEAEEEEDDDSDD